MYTCLGCRLFDNMDKGQFHCEECGVCHTGGEHNFSHCKKCNKCYLNSVIDSHKCPKPLFAGLLSWKKSRDRYEKLWYLSTDSVSLKIDMIHIRADELWKCYYHLHTVIPYPSSYWEGLRSSQIRSSWGDENSAPESDMGTKPVRNCKRQ